MGINERFQNASDREIHEHALATARFGQEDARSEEDREFWARIERLVTNRNYLIDEKVELKGNPLTSSFSREYREMPEKKGTPSE